MFGGNFAPRGWARCQGQLLSIANNQALFSILGTTYGGDGRTTFGLPDLRGRVPMSDGGGPGLSNHSIGQKGGTETNTLTVAQTPSHNHTASLNVNSSGGNNDNPSGNYLASNSEGIKHYSDSPDSPPPGDPAATANAGSINVGNSGGSQPHTNMQPFLAVNFVIALEGTFPSRN